VIEQVNSFTDFQSYLEHQLKPNADNGNKPHSTLSNLWSPPVNPSPSQSDSQSNSQSSDTHIQTTTSSRSLPPPYAYFDLNTHTTRLTWCDSITHHTSGTDMEHIHVSENNRLWDTMRNRRLMFIGDSITRYQYIALTTFLTTQEWSSDEKLVNEHYYEGGWTEFYQNTTAFHQGMELCECYRSSCCSPVDISENRKYVNPKLNTTVWYFQWFGDNCLPHGHFSLEKDIQPLECMPSSCKLSATKQSWIAKSATEFILQFVQAQQPDHVIMNTGLHVALNGKTEMSFREGMYWRSHHQQLLSSSTKFIFKSTTLNFRDKELIDNREADFLAYQYAVSGLWEYWDIAAVIYDLYLVYRKLELPYYYFRDEKTETGQNKASAEGLPLAAFKQRGFTWDAGHYHPWVYHELNKLLIRKFYLR
jgi:hypothetical protein